MPGTGSRGNVPRGPVGFRSPTRPVPMYVIRLVRGPGDIIYLKAYLSGHGTGEGDVTISSVCRAAPTCTLLTVAR